MHQISFPPVRDRLEGLSPGARMSADVLIMQNLVAADVLTFLHKSGVTTFHCATVRV